MSTYEITDVNPSENTMNVLWDGKHSFSHSIPLNDDGSTMTGPALREAIEALYPRERVAERGRRPTLPDAYLLTLIGKTGTF